MSRGEHYAVVTGRIASVEYPSRASCNEDRQKPPDPFKLVSDKELAAGAPQPARMVPRGHYAYQIVWNDGHDAGIYTLELLRHLIDPK